MERFVLLLIALVVTTQAGPVQRLSVNTPDACSTHCTESSKFHYEPGTTYVYQYDMDTRTSVSGASEDHSGIHMSATVHMEVFSKCELSMRLSYVTLTEYDPEKGISDVPVSLDFNKAMEKNPLRISYQDGTVDTLCLADNEPNWVVNIKRGVLSTFQNRMDDLKKNQTVTETDVSGNCETTYTTAADGWYSMNIKKSKNLLGCTDRTGYNTVVQGVPYTANSDIQSLPLIKSTHECDHEIDTQARHVMTASCKEEHMFRPFSRDDSGIVTRVTQKLKHLHQNPDIQPPAQSLRRASLIFEHSNDPDQEMKTRKDVERKLMEICVGTNMGVTEKTPQLFTELVYMMKSADARTLTDIHMRITDGSICSENKDRIGKFFLDALPVVGTASSLHVMTTLLTGKVVTGIEASMWLTSLAFIKNPTKDMLTEIKPLISLENNEAMLSVGSLIHSYCHTHDGCETDSTVRALVSIIEGKIAKGCKVVASNFKTTLIALRAIGNAGYAQTAIPTLNVCMRVMTTPVEIRLSAIEAFRRMPCNSDKSQIMTIFLDKEEDSEIRIAAYKSLMECPSRDILTQIKRTLETEEINQVGSYVWTHLTNIMETSDRHKQDIRAILEDEGLMKEFDLDKKKFSRNYEGSVFVEKLNTGAKVEGDLIWSSKSFMPRSAMVNFTVDLFGHSVNFLELGGRAEGLEYFLEKMFGPSGYFSKPEAKASDQKDLKLIKPDKMKRIDQRFAQHVDQLRGSLYMRVFGNELRHMNFQGLDSLMTGPNFNFLEMMIQLAQDNDYTFSQSVMFLDSSIIVPTGAGLPMNLTVNGTAVIDLKLKGKMDMRTPPMVDIDAMIHPSTAVDISGMMSVDAFVTKAGIKMVSTLLSNTAIHGKLHVNEAGVLTAEYELPQPRMDIISAKSSFFTIHRNTETEQEMIVSDRRTESLCTPAKLVTITGLELCAEIAYPNASLQANAPYFPLTGPVSAGLYLHNRDTHHKYKMEARSSHTKTSNLIHFMFNTPGSATDRNIIVDFNLNKASHSVGMTLTSPWKKANFQGVVTNTNAMKSISGKMNVDGQPGYSVNAQVLQERVGGNGRKYSPSLEIKLPGRAEPMAIYTSVQYNGYQSVDVEYSMKGFPTQPITAAVSLTNKRLLQGIKGNLVVDNDQGYSFDMRLSQNQFKKKTTYEPMISVRTPSAEVLSFGGTINHMFNKKFDVNLVLDKVFSKKVLLNGNVMQLTRKKNRVIYSTRVNFESSPADFTLITKIDNRAFKTIATNFDFTYIIRRIARNNIKLVSKITNLSSSTLTKGKGSLNFAVKRNPELNVKMIGNVDHSQKQSEADLDIRYGADYNNEDTHIIFSGRMKRNFKSLMSASADVQARLRHQGMGVNMIVKGNHKHDKRAIDTTFSVRSGNSMPLKTSLRYRDSTSSLMKVSGEFDLSYPGREIILNHTVEQLTMDKYVSTFNSQLQKEQKNSFVTIISQPHESGLAVRSNIVLHGCTPTTLKAEWNFDTMDFLASTSIEKDSRKYAATLSSVSEMDKATRLTVDIYHPSRRVILTAGGKNADNLYSAEMMLKWNAGRNDTERVILSGWVQPPSASKINGSISLSYPSRSLTLNAHHVTGAKYSTHADFSWEKEKKISIDSAFGKVRRRMVGQVKLRTPFDGVRSVNIDMRHHDNNAEYRTLVTAAWDPKETVSTILTIRKPFSLRTLIGSIETKSTLKLFKKIKLELDHKLSNSLDSSMRFSWNKLFLNADISLVNTTKGKRIGGKGDLGIQTSFPYMKKARMTVSHESDGRTINTIVKAIRNKKVYNVNSKISNVLTGTGFDSTGKVDMNTPQGDVITSWNHKHTPADIASTLTTAWGKKLGKQITVKLNGDHKLSMDEGTMNAAISFQSPFQASNDLTFQLTHVHRSKFLDSMVKLASDGKTIASAEAALKTSPEDLDTGVSVTIPGLDVDSYIKATGHAAQKEPLSLVVDCVITPEISSSLELKQHLDVGKHLDSLRSKSSAMWKSTYPGLEQITYTYEVEAEDSVSTKAKLEYGVGKAIELITKLKMTDKEHTGFASLTTPYANLTRLQGEISFLGDLDAFTSDVHLEILPLLNRISASASWDTTDGLTSKLRVDTPFREVPYFQVFVDAKEENRVIDASAMVEYLPRRTIRLEGTYNLNDPSVLDVSSRLTSPVVTSILSLKGNYQSFKSRVEINKYGLDIGFTNANKIECSATLSIPGRRDIVGSFSHTGTADNFACHAEILHNRKNYFTSDLHIATDNMLSLSGSASLKTEVISDELYQLSFMHNGPPTNFKCHAEFTTQMRKSEVDAGLDLSHDKQGSFSIKNVPFMKDIETSFSHHQRQQSLQSRMELIHGVDKTVDILAVIDVEDSVVGELSITTPLSENIQLRVRMDGEPQNFALHTEGSLGVLKSEVDITSHIASNYLQEVVTFRGKSLPDIRAEISHNGPISDFRSFALLTVNRDSHRVDATFSKVGDLDATASLISPLIKPITAKFSIQQPKASFNSHAELNIGNDRSEVDAAISVSPTVQGTISMNTPYWMDISAGFDHIGQFPNSRSHAQLRYEGSDKFDILVTSSNENLIAGSVTLATPIKNFEDIRSSFSHDGGLNNFKCHAEFAIKDNKTEADIYYSSQNRYEGLIALKSHLIPDVSVGFEHSGPINRFKTHAEYNYAFQKGELDVSFDVVKDIEANLRIKHPAMEEMSAAFTHRGQLDNFVCHAAVTQGSHSEEIDISFSNTTKIKGEFAIKNGLIARYIIAGLDDITLSFEHSGIPSNFKSQAELISGSNSVNGDISFSVSPNSLLSSLRIKSTLNDEININLQHSGAESGLRTHGDISVGSKKAVMDVDLTIADNIDGTLMINAPNVEINVRHSGKLTNFNTHGDLRIGNNRQDADVSVLIDDDVIIRVVFPEFELNVKHSGNRLNCKSHVDMTVGTGQREADFTIANSNEMVLKVRAPEVDLNVDFASSMPDFTYHSDLRIMDSKKHVLDMALTTGSEIVGSIKMSGSEFELDINHFGKLSNFRSHAYVTVGNRKSEYSITCSVKEIIDASLTVSTPEFSLNAVHTGKLSSFRSHGELTIGDERRETELSLTVGEHIDGNFVITLPEHSLKINHQGNQAGFRSTVELKNVSDLYTAEVQLDIEPSIRASFTAATPIVGYESFKALYTHDGKMTNFNCHGELSVPDSVSNADLKVNVEDLNDLDISVSVSSPIIPEISVEIDHTRSQSSYKSRAEVTVDKEVISGLVLTFSNKTELNGALQITTPIAAYRNIRMEGKLEGQIKNFRTTTELVVGTDKHEAIVTFSSEPKLEGSVIVKTVYFPNIQADIGYSGKPSNFLASSELRIDGERKASIEGSLNIEQGIQTTLSLTTPLENYTSMGLEFSHLGDLSDFHTTAVISLNGQKLIDTSVSLANGEIISGEAIFKSPYLHPVHVNIEHSGDLLDFSASGHITHDGQRILTSMVEFNLKPQPFQSAGSLTINNYSSKYSIEGEINNFKAHTEANVNSDFYSADVGFTYKLDDMDASFLLKVPRREVIQGTFSHVSRPRRCTTHASFSSDTSSKYEYDAVVKFRHGVEGTFSIKTPLAGLEESKLDFANVGNFPNIRSNADISYGNKDIHISGRLNHATDTRGALSFTSPFEGYENLELSVYHDGDVTNFQSRGSLVYNGEIIEASAERSFTGHSLHSRFNFKSPFTNEILISVNHTGGLTDFTTDTLLAMGHDTRVKTETTFQTREQYISLMSVITISMTGETYTQKAEFKHEGNLQNFKTEAALSILGSEMLFDAAFHLKPVIEGSVSLRTPFRNFEDMKASFSHSGTNTAFLTSAEVQYAPMKKIEGKLDVLQHGFRRMVTTVELRTPFPEYDSKITYQHNSDSDSFQSEADIAIIGKKMTTMFRASKSPLHMALNMRTPFVGYESITLTGNLDLENNEKYSSRIEAALNPAKRIVLDGSLSLPKRSSRVQGSASITTSFEILRRAAVEFSHQKVSDKYMESAKFVYNGQSIFDAEIDHSLMNERKNAVVTIRAPQPMKFELAGDFTLTFVDVMANANWDTDSSDSNVRVLAGYDVRMNKDEKSAMFKITRPSQVIQYSGILAGSHSRSLLSWGIGTTQQVGYDVTINNNDITAKVILPQRSVKVTGSHRGMITDGSLLWDADVDQTKKIGFRSVVMPSDNSIKADFTLMLPTLGRNVQLGSEMIVNRGRVIFDGKTEFSYSNDERKKIVISSRLEDISSGSSSKNYSFTLGMSHPYSTIGIKVASHIGKSPSLYSGGIGLEYVTARRQTKTFQMNGQINKLRRTISFELQSPVKSITISGTAQTDNKFRVSMLNVYDRHSPLITAFTVDPARRSIDFTMNYDLDNPRSEFHFNARYVNSSAVAAEVYHVVNNDRVSDVLLAVRLNNSHLLHSRLHWRPEMTRDLQVLRERKLREYKLGINEIAAEIGENVLEEMAGKADLIYRAIEEEIGSENMDGVIIALTPLWNYGTNVSSSVYKSYARKFYSAANYTQISYNSLVAKYSPSNAIRLPAMDFLRSPSSSVEYAFGITRLPVNRVPSRVIEALKYRTRDYLPLSIKQQLINTNQLWEVETNFESAIESFLHWILQDVEKDVQELMVVASIKSPITVYDPAHGEIQAEFRLPIPVKSLDVMPVVDLSHYVNKVMKYIPRDTKLSMPSLSGPWIPPFNAVASVQKGHRITTFDGHTYDLAMDCTFVLVRDYRDGNFSVILSNKQPTTVMVLSRGKSIEITQTEVSVNGKPVTLPFRQHNTTISQLDEGLIEVDSTTGYTVLYDTALDYLRVTINGWYHGKTGGLFGIYDNEPSNDMMTSYNKVIDSPKRFARTWDVGTSVCR